MDRFKFWKSREPTPVSEPVPTIKRFNIQARTDIGTLGLPADLDKAARVVALRRRREALVHDVASAEEAGQEHNRWRTEVDLIDQAILETERDLGEIGATVSPPGTALPALPITQITCQTEPVVRVEFRIGDVDFAFAEEIDWAERGFQVARGELIPEHGNVASLIPETIPESERAALASHLERSVFAFASDVRERTLNEKELPTATLTDLARPSVENGGWLDWTGQSPVQQAHEAERNRLRSELERLRSERSRLIEDEARTAERLPVARRRLAELDREIEEITQDT